MPVSIRYWYGWPDARAGIATELSRRGFRSATQYAAAQPRAALRDLISGLGIDSVHEGHLHVKLWEEAAEAGTMEYCARDQLARDLRYHISAPPARSLRNVEDVLASVFYMWEKGLPTIFQPAAMLIYQSLRGGDMPSGWTPSGADDPNLIETFGNHWPLEISRRKGRLVTNVTDGLSIVYDDATGRPVDS